jgi:HK97 gp10 family phage protein
MITATILGQEALIADIQQIPARAIPEIQKTTEMLAIKLSAYVQKNKLSGQVLRNRTGTLRRSINYKVSESGGEFTAIVGTNKEYAHIHEYGFQGQVTVKEHMRMMKTAFGKTVKNPRKITVRAHSMHMNMPARSFLRTALAEFEPTIIREYEAVIERILA